MRGNWMRLVTAAASVAALAGAVGLPATLVVRGHVRVPRLATPPTVSRSVVHALPSAIALPRVSKAPARRLPTAQGRHWRSRGVIFSTAFRRKLPLRSGRVPNR